MSDRTGSAIDHWFDTMGRYPVLSKSETLRLARQVQAGRIQLSGPACRLSDRKQWHDRDLLTRRAERAANQLVSCNLRLIVHLWTREQSQRFPLGHPQTPDLLQCGAVALMRAAVLFDPTRGYAFSTYGATWIRKGFRDFFKQNRLIYMPQNALNAATETRKYLEACEKTHTPPNEAYLELVAQKNWVNKKNLRMYVEQARITHCRSADEASPAVKHGGRGSVTILEMLEAPAQLEELENPAAAKQFDLIASRAQLDPEEREILLASAQGFKAVDLDRVWKNRAPHAKTLASVRQRFRIAANQIQKQTAASLTKP